MDGTTIDLRKLTLEELTGVINIYPWFGAARRELCLRVGPEVLAADGGRLFAETALYVPCRKRLSEIASRGKASSEGSHRDADVEALVKSRVEAALKASQAEEMGTPGAKTEAASTQGNSGGYHREVRIVGGDYFSKDDYASVKENIDAAEIFKNIVPEKKDEKASAGLQHLGFYTETLAAIYAEQGYFDEAKTIYSQLILAYPEKSAYFASLIEKLDER